MTSKEECALFDHVGVDPEPEPEPQPSQPEPAPPASRSQPRAGPRVSSQPEPEPSQPEPEPTLAGSCADSQYNPAVLSQPRLTQRYHQGALHVMADRFDTRDDGTKGDDYDEAATTVMDV